jgi:hypothetical protein
MNDTTLDPERVSEILRPIMEAVRTNYLHGPISRDRVFESLNALAMAVSLIVEGCDDPDALKFFSDALNCNLRNRNFPSDK